MLAILIGFLFFLICILFVIPPFYKSFLKLISLYGTLFIFLLSLLLWLAFDNLTAKFQYSYIFSFFNLNCVVGIDGISLFFIILTAIITPICLLLCVDLDETYYKKINFKVMLLLILIIEFFLFLSFVALDFFYFFIFFETLLLPMFFLVLIFGSRTRKIKASFYLFLYTLFGSIFFFFAILMLYSEFSSTNLYTLMTLSLNYKKQIILWICIFLAFAVKIPMFPFHIWLPEAHVEAPTVGSIILAALLLKLGGYGFLRFLLPICPYATIYFLPVVYILCILGIVIASLTALRQLDIKRIIAYSSIAHMNFVVLGIFSLNFYGIVGSILLMLAHGITSTALFFLVGILYSRYHTRLVTYYSGLTTVMPIFAVFFTIFTFTNISFPGLCNFIGELLILFSLVYKNFFITIFITAGLFLSAAYSLYLLNRILFGSLKTENISLFVDVTRLEFALLLILLALNLYIGISPSTMLESINFTVKFLLTFL